MNQVQISPARRIERLPNVMARIGLSKSWIYRELAANRFPKPLKFGRATAWDSTVIVSNGARPAQRGQSGAVEGAP